MFNLNQSTGEIAVARKLDRETVQRYMIQVEAWDNGNPPLSNIALVSIVLRDANDNSPIFSPSTYSATVDDSALVGNTILRVACSDKDQPGTANSALRYKIVSDEETKSTFQVNSDGDIILMRRLNFARRKSYNITMQASDSGAKPLVSSNNATVSIAVVTQRFSFPQFDYSEYSFRVSKDIVVPHYLGEIHAVYFNPLTGNDELVYAVKSGDSNGNFNVSSSGKLSVINSLNKKADLLFALEISATDSQNQSISNTTVIQIVVLDVNDFYPDLSPSGTVGVFVSETAGIHQPLLAFSCTDYDTEANNTVNLSLVNTADIFILSNNTLFLKKQPTISTNMTVNLTVQCSDSGDPQLASQTQVRAHFIKENLFDPTFSSDLYYAGIKEDTEIGTSVYTVFASDDDNGQDGEIEYSLRKSDGDFTIDLVSGTVYTAKLLDREKHGEYSLEVVAVDKGVPPRSGTAKLTVKILDVNDNGPRCEKATYTVNVSENANAVVNLNCTDCDAMGIPMYKVLDASDPGVFLVSASGVVMVNHALNQKASTDYFLRVQVFDPDLVEVPAINVTVIIHVIRENDYTPVFQDGDFVNLKVAEHTSIGTTVAYVTAIDDDLGPDGRVQYSLVGGTGIQKFAINSTDCGIHVIRSLAFASGDRFSLIIEATDQSVVQHTRKTATTHVTIVVFHINPTLYLDKYNVAVERSVEVGTVVVQASCDSTSDILAFRLEKAGEINGDLSVNRQGVVRVRAKLNNIQPGNYSVTVICEDRNLHTSRGSFVLTVLDSAIVTPPVMVRTGDLSTQPSLSSTSITPSKASDSSMAVIMIAIGGGCGLLAIILIAISVKCIVGRKKTRRYVPATDMRVTNILNNEISLDKRDHQRDIENGASGDHNKEASSTFPDSHRHPVSLFAVKIGCSKQETPVEEVVEEQESVKQLPGKGLTSGRRKASPVSSDTDSDVEPASEQDRVRQAFRKVSLV
jgi:hypothetical protein